MGTMNIPNHGFDKDKNIVNMSDDEDIQRTLMTLKAQISDLSTRLEIEENKCPIPVNGIHVTINGTNPKSIWPGTTWELMGKNLKHKDGTADYEPNGPKYVMLYNDANESYNKTNISAGGTSQYLLSEAQLPTHRHFVTNPMSGKPAGGGDLPDDKRIYLDWQSDLPDTPGDGKHYIWSPKWGVSAGESPAWSGMLWYHDGAGKVTSGGALRTEDQAYKVDHPNQSYIDNRPPAIVLAFWRRTS